MITFAATCAEADGFDWPAAAFFIVVVVCFTAYHLLKNR